MTPSEVAELYRVDRRTLRRWVRQGKLHPVRLTAGTWRFRAEDVAGLIEGGSAPDEFDDQASRVRAEEARRHAEQQESPAVAGLVNHLRRPG
jgi:excisionase family DNA binding protein